MTYSYHTKRHGENIFRDFDFPMGEAPPMFSDGDETWIRVYHPVGIVFKGIGWGGKHGQSATPDGEDQA